MRAHVHRWTPIVAGIALVAAALLPAVPIDASHSKWEIHHRNESIQGDTYVFKLDSSEGFTIKQGSTIGLSATYDEKRRDTAFAWAWTDLDDDHTQVLAYDADRSAEETHVKVLSDSEHAIEYDRSKSNGDPLTPGTISNAIKFRQDTTFEAGSWHFVVSGPEAAEIGISVHLDLDRELSIAAEAPAGNRTFATLLLEYTPFVGAAHYGVDGPGDHDAERTDVSVVREIRHQGWAHIPAGPAGDYTYWVDAKAWAGPASYADQHHGVLYAAPMPL